ncbi:MAG: two-component sensor histidine kinase [Lachnospiraceae bacterium]|nr:two-component sensor histidine kinase [Lachnospiraceae bacterium]
MELQRKKRKKLQKSLQGCLFVLFVLIGFVPMRLVNDVTGNMVYKALVNQKTSEVQSQCTVMANQLTKDGYLNNLQAGGAEAELEVLSSVYDARILVINSAYVVVKDTFSLAEGRINTSDVVFKCFAGTPSVEVNHDGGYIVFTRPIYNSTGDTISGVLLMSASIEQIGAIDEQLGWKSGLLEIILAMVLVVISAILARVLVIPLYKVAVAFNRTAVGEKEAELSRVSVDDYRETVLISEAYNKTADRLRILDESRQEFVSNVSHELKTPLASIRVLADSLLAAENVPEELYREFLQDISAGVDREQQIIDDLLTLVKVDRTKGELNITKENINDLVERTMKELLPIAEKKNVELVLESFRPVVAEIDALKMSLAVSNLIENAIKYNNDGGWVRVSLNADHKFFYIKVADNGIGIPEESQEQVFSRFYRVDKARSRESGGTGLGLAITESVIHSHHGAIRLFSKENVGSTFTVRVPLIYIA